MDRGPEQPGGETAEADAAEVGHGRASPDGRHAALVAVPERRAIAPFQAPPDDARHIAALLHGDRGHARKRSLVLVGEVRDVADREDLRATRQRAVGLDEDASGAIEGSPGFLLQHRSQGRGPHARGPEHAPRGHPLAIASRLQSDPLLVQILHQRLHTDVCAKAFE